jgi:hypothetical protein
VKHILSPLFYQLSSHYYLKDFCKDNHPEINPETCAHFYGFMRKIGEYDNLQKSGGSPKA